MKKFVTAAIAAAATLATPAVASAQHYRGDTVRTTVVQKRNGAVVQKTTVRRDARPFQQRRWAKGQRFDARYARNYRVIHNPRAYRLYDAPRGYRWVQSGSDAVLVGITSGIIGAVIGGLIR